MSAHTLSNLIARLQIRSVPIRMSLSMSANSNRSFSCMTRTMNTRSLIGGQKALGTRPCAHSGAVCMRWQSTGAPGKPDILEVRIASSPVELHYVQYGDGPHAVLFIPGALGCAETDFPEQFGPNSPFFKPEFLKKYRLVCVDPRGYGKSRPPQRDYPLNFYDRDADDIAVVMQKLGIEKYSVVGWSDGGNVGLIMAAQYPMRIQRLITIGSNSFVSKVEIDAAEAIKDTSKWNARAREPYVRVYGEKGFHDLWQTCLAGFRRIYVEREQPWPTLYGIAYGTHKKGSPTYEQDVARSLAEGGNAEGGWPGEIVRARLPIVQCPVLVFQGGKDKMCAPYHANVFEREIFGSKIIRWPEAGHNLHIHPATAAKFNEEMLKFLEEQKL